MRTIIAAAALAASAGAASPEANNARISDATISDLEDLPVLGPHYQVSYTIENTSDRPIESIIAVVIGRNAEGQIVENREWTVFTASDLPGGLSPGDSFVEAHPLKATNPSETAVSIEVRFGEITFSEN